ncbi:MAG: YggS family pyridoxal phosphate-dependent enzyme [Gemmatimonadales bacterium]
MNYRGLSERLTRVRERIAEAQRVGGWSHPVTVIGVTKGHGPEAVTAAVAAGLTDVGENRVQEALAKQDALADLAVAWHLIGSLQRNKARQAVGRFAVIHSVDRLELADAIAKRVPEGGSQRVLVEVNCSGEVQKGGVAPDAAADLIGQLRTMPGLSFAGLMTMAPLTDESAVQRASFARLRSIRESLERQDVPVDIVSMGMSGDFAVAVEEGATHVRLGTILFGEREP